MRGLTKAREAALTLVIWAAFLALLVGGCALAVKSDTKRDHAKIGRYDGDHGP